MKSRPFKRIGSEILRFESVGSTNDVAASIVAEKAAVPILTAPFSPEGLVVVAGTQTAGRGRRGHLWFSPPGAGLYVSVVLAPGRARVDPARATMLLTLAAGVGLAEGIQSATGLDVNLKWPNDLFAGNRKLGGILAESSSTRAPLEWVVLGYGINVSAAAYPPELADCATSLESELGRAVDREHVLEASLASLDERYDDLIDGRFDAILDGWRRRATLATGARVAWSTPDGVCRGITTGIDDCGALLVQTADGIQRIVSGEITWEF